MAGVETRLRSYPVEELVSLPVTHPDRVAIEGMAQKASSLQILTGERLPLRLKPSNAELDLYELWVGQAQKLVKLGFHKEFGLTKKEYLASLPLFELQPPEYKGRLDLPLLVETRIPWERQAELASISITGDLRTDAVHEWEGNNSQTPNTPYAGWFNNWSQRFYEPIPPILDARGQLAADECGAGMFEGIALQIHHPEITASGKYFDLIGYSAGSDGIPYLRHLFDRPMLSTDWGVLPASNFRPLIRGTKIVTSIKPFQ